jgi:hypothetical protein
MIIDAIVFKDNCSDLGMAVINAATLFPVVPSTALAGALEIMYT